ANSSAPTVPACYILSYGGKLPDRATSNPIVANPAPAPSNPRWSRSHVHAVDSRAPLVEAAVRSRVARHRLGPGVRGGLRLQLLRVLRLPTCAKKNEIADPRGELLAPERLLGAPAERELPRRALTAADDCLGEPLRLGDRRDRPWL